ncbi:1-(5-phosphoribosyl)-5-[(5-phosphoribosylamino)methylideneamino] imidazole-4-carboxamide isomerase [Pontibacillus halophilus JSM 076056 = DSM 19796]|uniref:1-(5-phosphoribosyl)-5-[(5-phosphoribosylamino)methylideneamino] imidazole-4-carboxamide isomerase n=1 Tax=Pontibacillus halophilus JSM 076056 = DSM 19796 TaxID=1385510 RepID=A0A0A5GI42_9BACI|nr:1-(5-phosphoribosyl)-5-[(5-phosphoribosylamino)methylideneamino]imidazole-4-carboxamide isomerase [Pontibacillus halophilus]KGX92911.1 1-(5-phosphoribosyl)-5-[(5-phosphoribosylamino)methylideneamino] imidazole-4-carboxamide isomerase [Pontibacillus halophilus JSM 076056 = DSM 19796]
MAQFTIYPAIDLRGGKCVRLMQGDFNRETIYGDSPIDVARGFSEQGSKWVHMVDLDGARDGKRVNASHIVQVAQQLDINVQMGGGIRTEEDVRYYLDNGVDRVIIGSLAITNPELTKELVSIYGSKIAIGIDARDGYVATEGWLTNSTKSIADVANYFAEAGVETFIFTDIAKDGMMSGPSTEAIVNLAKESGKEIIASGGVRHIEDLQELKRYASDGVGGAIVGKAIYTNELNLQQALEEVDGSC